jgi:undecaprenyl diphosphate synthase
VIEDRNIRERLKKNGKLPRHVAIIMDGNGRWAKQRGLPRIAGHREGVKAVRDVVEGCGELGVNVLTLYTFSTENWRRPKEEVSALMKLLLRTLQKEIDDLVRNNVRLMAVGNIDHLPTDARKGILDGIDTTKNNTGLILNLALNYGGREEIVAAVRKVAEKIQTKALKPEDIDKEIFGTYLYTSELPDPDLLIRTSGELRISNFLLWQLAYTEIYITDVLWPDFRRHHLYQAIEDYQKRERRFGKVSEQLIEDTDPQVRTDSNISGTM